ncbi:hypothetical protein FA09DRAFT_363230 [Tilletiopsis washingtonensis]|uniref:Uncharacterized protein n=1 Tax=Tilletiopsis washingtonensis TaxID=58919 RepID=A0A316Z1U0_9BASI|nr:hypothetical protein FA09DRAFT_363230 [Tilletiopsis washingtonensis]PWN95064.1 hypothetical protein FA09DRAFT_363230 [Tilletiopsis washingtonensis]
MYLTTLLEAVDGQADRLEMLLARRLARQNAARTTSGRGKRAGARQGEKHGPQTTFARDAPRASLNRFVLHTPLELSPSESSTSSQRRLATSAPAPRYFSSAYAEQLQQFAFQPEPERRRRPDTERSMHQLHAHDALVAHLRAAGVLRAAQTHVTFARLDLGLGAPLPEEPLSSAWQLDIGGAAPAEGGKPRSVPMQRECPLVDAWEGAWLGILPLAAAHETQQQARCPIMGTQRLRRAKL